MTIFDSSDAARRAEIDRGIVAGYAHHIFRRQNVAQRLPFLRSQIEYPNSVERACIQTLAIRVNRVEIDCKFACLGLERTDLAGRQQLKNPASVSSDKETVTRFAQRRDPVGCQRGVRVFIGPRHTPALDLSEAA